MSEYEDDEENVEDRKTVRVEIAGHKEELERLREILSQLALQEASKYGLTPEDLDSMTAEEIFAYTRGLEERQKKEPKKVPSGVVTLKTGSKTSNLRNKEFDSAKEMIEFLGERARSGDKEALDALNQLWLKKASSRGLALNCEFNEVPAGLKPNFSYQEYTEWIRNQSKKVNQK